MITIDNVELTLSKLDSFAQTYPYVSHLVVLSFFAVTVCLLGFLAIRSGNKTIKELESLLNDERSRFN